MDKFLSEALVKQILGFVLSIALPYIEKWVADSSTQWDDWALDAVKQILDKYLDEGE